MQEKKSILDFIKKVMGRLWLVAFVEFLGRYLLAASFLTAGLLAISCFVPVYKTETLVQAICAFFCFMAVVHSFCITRDIKKAALAADGCGLDERLITSYEQIDSEDVMSCLQRKDTISHIQHFSLRQHFPLRPAYKKWAGIAFLSLLALVAALTDTPAKKQAALLHAMEVQAKEKQETLKAVQKDLDKLAKEDVISEEELAKIEKVLSDFTEEMAQAQDEKELAKAKERMEKKLEQVMENSEKEELAKVLDTIAEDMDLTEQAQFMKGLSALAKENDVVKNHLEDLQDLAGDLTSQKKAELLGMLQDAQENEALDASAMVDILNALGQADAGLVAQALANEEGVSQNAGEQMSGASLSGQTGTGTQSGNGQSAGGQNGTGENGQGGNGNGNENSNGKNGSGHNGNGSGTGYDTGSRYGMEKKNEAQNTEEMITIPGKTKDDANLTGKKQGKSSYKVKGGDSAAFFGSRIGYSQVVDAYTQDAYGKVKEGKVPKSMEDVVKSYFSELNE